MSDRITTEKKKVLLLLKKEESALVDHLFKYLKIMKNTINFGKIKK